MDFVKIKEMNNKLAVDVVLLPPLEAMQRIISLIEYSPNPPIKLNTHGCLPHISLTMGILAKEDLNKASETLNQIAANYQPIPVNLTGIDFATRANGQRLNELAVEPNKILVDLHREVLTRFKLYLTNNAVQASMFLFPEKVDKHSTEYVKHYHDKHGGKDFYPHITLGEGKVKNLDSHLQFTANRFSLAQMGPYNTCRKILFETLLG